MGLLAPCHQRLGEQAADALAAIKPQMPGRAVKLKMVSGWGVRSH
jgi:hypothetical protein